MASDYAKSLGARLRSIRQQQGLSLQGVEEKSAGRWKAVVVGSYERGDRAVTVSRLAELADFYRVPVAELLPEGGSTRTTPPARSCSTWRSSTTTPRRPGLRRQVRPGDPAGRAATTTAGCSRSAPTTCARSPSCTTTPPTGLVDRLNEHGVLVEDPRAFFNDRP